MVKQCSFFKFLKCQISALLGLTLMVLSLSDVQVVLADNTGSCVDLKTVNGDDMCYTVTPPEVPDISIDVNGTIDAGEWALSQIKPIGSTVALPLSGEVRFLRSEDSLYLAIIINDLAMLNDDNDVVQIYFDPLHSVSTMPQTDDFRLEIFRDPTASINRVPLDGSAVTIFPANGSELNAVQIVETTSGWNIEVKLHKSAFGLANFPDVFGIAIHAASTNSFENGFFPATGFSPDLMTVTNQNPSTWANLKTRFPINYEVVLDLSGSMNSPIDSSDPMPKAKIQAAKEVVSFTANMMDALDNPSYFEDLIGLIGFSTFKDIIGTEIDPDGGGELNPLTSPDLFVAAIPDRPSRDTPLAAGVRAAISQLNTSMSVEVNKQILLISDGLHNAPNSTILPGPNDMTAGVDFLDGPCAGVMGADPWVPCSLTDVNIHSVSIGNGVSVDAPLMNNIATYFTPESADNSANNYHVTQDVAQLKQFAMDTLSNVYALNLVETITGVPIVTAANMFTVSGGNSRLILAFSWDDAMTMPDPLLVNLSDGSMTTPSCSELSVDRDVGLAFCVVNNPPASASWNISNAAALVANDLHIYVDLKLDARFAVDTDTRSTDESVLLTAELNFAGLGLVNDLANHPVEVSVDIDAPGESLGTFISTLNNACERVDTTSPSARTTMDSSLQTLGLQRLLACNLTSLKRDKQRLFLKDDGLNGDTVANDGIYSLRLNNTTFAGTYVFNFSATGITPDGDAFKRSARFSKYVRVAVDLDNSLFNSRVLSEDNGMREEEYFIRPQDANGNLLGPGNSFDVNFLVGGAEIIKPLVQYTNGLYAVTIRYPITSPQPVVIPQSQGDSLGSNCEYGYNAVWNDGFVGYIRITNTGSEPINGWQVGWEYTNSQTIFHSWIADVQGTNPYTASNLSYNTVINPGESIEFGFEGRKQRDSDVEVPIVAGAACIPN